MLILKLFGLNKIIIYLFSIIKFKLYNLFYKIKYISYF